MRKTGDRKDKELPQDIWHVQMHRPISSMTYFIRGSVRDLEPRSNFDLELSRSTDTFYVPWREKQDGAKSSSQLPYMKIYFWKKKHFRKISSFWPNNDLHETTDITLSLTKKVTEALKGLSSAFCKFVKNVVVSETLTLSRKLLHFFLQTLVLLGWNDLIYRSSLCWSRNGEILVLFRFYPFLTYF